MAVGDAVLPDTPVITLGDAGSPGSVHLHLEIHVSGEVMSALGASAGRVWPLADRERFFGSKRSSGLSGASLAGAAPAAFYIVNPETYLWRRIPFRPNVLAAEQYIRQGLSRPDGLTLPPTCAPSADMLARGGMVSTNGGQSALGGVSTSGVAAMANTQTLVGLASSDGRDAVIQFGQAAIGAARMGANSRDATSRRISVLAGLILTGADR